MPEAVFPKESNNYMNKMSISDFSGLLAAKTAVPGGGGAAALVGALGAALASMVANFTIGKPKHADIEPDIRKILAEADSIRQELLICIDEDAKAYDALANAYRTPKDDPDYNQTLENCLHGAAEVPLKILKYACRTIELHKELSEKCSGTIVSDAGAGAALSSAVLCASALNIRVNTKSMSDRQYAETLNSSTDILVEKYRRMSDEIYSSLCRRFS